MYAPTETLLELPKKQMKFQVWFWSEVGSSYFQNFENMEVEVDLAQYVTAAALCVVVYVHTNRQKLNLRIQNPRTKWDPKILKIHFLSFLLATATIAPLHEINLEVSPGAVLKVQSKVLRNS